MEIKMDEYTAAGYFVTTYTHREVWMDPFLLPEQIVSLSGCISNMCQIAWKWSNVQPEESKQLGISPEKWDDFLTWCNEKQDIDIGYPDTFLSLDAARRAIKQFFQPNHDLIILGLGIYSQDVDSFLEKYAESGESYGVYKTLKQGKHLEPDGEILGFDVLGYENGINHSWLCYNIEQAVDEKWAIQTNELGVFETNDEAQLVVEHANKKAPGWGWRSWLVTRYMAIFDESDSTVDE